MGDTASGASPLSARQIATATRIAHETTSKISGTLVGALASIVVLPADERANSKCPAGRLYQVRVVWKGDANFTHGSAPIVENGPVVAPAVATSTRLRSNPGGPPDGPLKAVIVYANLKTSKVCLQGATYRSVGAAPDETLLYGKRPHDPTGPIRQPRG